MSQQQIHFLHQMLRIRRFEEKAAELYSARKIRGFLHLYVGEEAIAVGSLAAVDPRVHEDAVVSTYREHGHALARGVSMRSIMAEMFGKATGCSRGRGGSMHLFDSAHRFFGGNAIVGAGLPIAVGLALADQRLGRSRITVCYFGDGAAAEGVFSESLNLAALWKVPVLFLCENNRYAMGTSLEKSHAQTQLAVKANAWGVQAVQADGMDVNTVYSVTQQAVAKIRSEGSPQFIEWMTYRFRAHSMYDPELYRSKDEVKQWKLRDPIEAVKTQLMSQKGLDELIYQQMILEIDLEIADAVEFAERSPVEPVDSLMSDLNARGKAS